MKKDKLLDFAVWEDLHEITNTENYAYFHSTDSHWLLWDYFYSSLASNFLVTIVIEIYLASSRINIIKYSDKDSPPDMMS
jgi:hypothetical protein